MNEIKLTDYELETIQGCLLGDGHISRNTNCKSSYFGYCSSEYEHVEYVWKQLKRLSTPRYENGPVKSTTYLKKTGKTYTTYSIRTRSNITFYNLRKKWYPDGVKIVPNDLNLSTNIIRFWYIGDGSLDKQYGYIKLCTDSFNEESINLLNEQLQKWESWINPNVNRIYIKRIHVKSFLEYIGNCPIYAYSHKWKTKQLKNPKLDIYGPSDYTDKYPLVVEDFKTKGYTIHQLSKKHKIPVKCIKNHFDNVGVKYELVDRRVRVEQRDLDGNYLKTWDSASSTPFDASKIVACCRGKRNKHKGYKWNYE